MVDQTLRAYTLFPLFSSPTITFSTIVPKTESLERLFLKWGFGKGGAGGGKGVSKSNQGKYI